MVAYCLTEISALSQDMWTKPKNKADCLNKIVTERNYLTLISVSDKDHSGRFVATILGLDVGDVGLVFDTVLVEDGAASIAQLPFLDRWSGLGLIWDSRRGSGLGGLGCFRFFLNRLYGLSRCGN